jgi:predicted lactoylglutathione lyase
MTYSPVLVSLPVSDRVRAYAFYQEALGLRAIGELADDGVPEPLIFALNEQTRLMLIPTGGFGWVVGHHQVAPPGTSECMTGIDAASDEHVVQIVAQAKRAGAEVITEPASQPWGFAGGFADPDGHLWMVTH